MKISNSRLYIMDYSFRLATYDDCERLSIIKKSVWNTTYRGIYKDETLDNFDVKIQTEKFKKMVDSDTFLYVIELNDTIIGYFSYGKPFHQYMDYEIEFGLLYILEEYQGRGIGSSVFIFVKDKLSNLNIDKFYLCCNKYNKKAQNFYEKMGGKVIHVDNDNIDNERTQIYYEYKISKNI